VHLDRRLLPWLGGARQALGLAVALGIAAGVLVVAQAALLARVVDGAFLRGEGLAAQQPLLLALAAAALVRAACLWCSDVSAQAAAASVKESLREALTRRVLMRGPAWTAGERTGELTRSLVDGVEALDAYVAQYVPQLLLAAAVPSLVLAVVALRDPLSGLVLLVTFPLIPAFMYLIGAQAAGRARRQWVEHSRLAAQFLDALQALPTLKAFGRSHAHAATLARAGERLRLVTLDVLKVAFLSAFVLELLATIGTALVAVEVGLRLLYARLAFGEALFVLILAPEFYRPLRGLGQAFHAGLAGKEALSRFVEILGQADATPSGLEAPGPLSGHVASHPAATLGPPRLEWRAVGFEYEAGRPGLRGVSLSIEPGQTLAVVGPSGSGKTTLAHLLLRFLEPTSGRLLVDGQPLDTMLGADWRARVAYVPQQPRLFAGSVRHNIALAWPDADLEAVEEAARRAAALDFIRALPDGFETEIGENGLRLSGGEAQRLALARAFLSDAPCLVLDEPTAQLDTATEARVREALRALRRGRSVLLITHRLTTAFDADRVALLAAGRVVEQGTHDELRATGSRYARLVAAWSAS
jgi:thiol reductant ABC exporter CydD subunit